MKLFGQIFLLVMVFLFLGQVTTGLTWQKKGFLTSLFNSAEDWTEESLEEDPGNDDEVYTAFGHIAFHSEIYLKAPVPTVSIFSTDEHIAEVIPPPPQS